MGYREKKGRCSDIMALFALTNLFIMFIFNEIPPFVKPPLSLARRVGTRCLFKRSLSGCKNANYSSF
jgi:hypothetical protein